MATQTSKLFLFNGPPYSGKDTLAQELCNQLEGKGILVEGRQPQTFKEPLLSLTIEFFGLYEQREYILANYERLKDSFKIATYELDGIGRRQAVMTLREAMIHVSEKYAKPEFGPGVWGQRLLQRIQSPHGILAKALVVSDLGFYDEMLPLRQAYGPENTHLIHVSANDDPLENQDWANDSRRYVYDETIRTTLIVNDRKLPPGDLIRDYLWSLNT